MLSFFSASRETRKKTEHWVHSFTCGEYSFGEVKFHDKSAIAIGNMRSATDVKKNLRQVIDNISEHHVRHSVLHDRPE
jgi:hypothetical protein